jgi:hypothetical protein
LNKTVSWHKVILLLVIASFLALIVQNDLGHAMGQKRKASNMYDIWRAYTSARRHLMFQYVKVRPIGWLIWVIWTIALVITLIQLSGGDIVQGRVDVSHTTVAQWAAFMFLVVAGALAILLGGPLLGTFGR